MKRFLLSLVALFASVSLMADVAVSTKTTGSLFNLLSTGGKVIDSVTVVPSGTNTVLRLYDSATTNITYVTAEYVTEVPTVSSVVTTWVGVTGVTNSITNSAMTMVTTTNAAATNTLPLLKVFATPSTAIGTITDPIILRKGLTISNDVACTVIVEYHSN